VSDGEVCDDGNTMTELACPYGTASCQACDASCSTQLTLSGGTCGDGAVNGEETCDDGNAATETSCPYGTASCTRCDATCTQPLTLTGSYCGDGLRSDGEVCDDGNALACGLCNATCTAAVGAASTGFLVITASGAELLAAQGESPATFSIDDGEHPSVTFQLVEDATSVEAGNIAVVYAAQDNAAALATHMIEAINSAEVALSVRATSVMFSSFILLENERVGSRGDQEIVETVDATGFSVLGMRGGSGADCGDGVGCTEGDVCASWQCDLEGDDGGVCGGGAPAAARASELAAGPRGAASHPGAQRGGRHIPALAGDAALRAR
jgi:cysteine-rich repeat protein